MKRRTFAAVLAVLCLISRPVLAARIAVLPAEGLEDAAVVLMAALSNTPDVEVVERERLDAVASEKNLQTMTTGQLASLGQLLHAQALVILDRPSTGPRFSCRLIAVDAGIVVAHDLASWPMDDPAGWAALQARRMAGLMAALPKKPGEGTLVALLGVRSPISGPEAQKLERDTAFTLAQALTGIPGVFSLERERLREADWEKQLSESAAGRFWSGAWLLDGNVEKTERGLSFSGQLRPVGNGTSKEILAQAADLEALGQAVAAAAAKILNAPGPVVIDPSAEATFFHDQAAWAFRWKLYEEAERAADASWLLGNKGEAVGSIRSLAPALAVDRQLPDKGSRFPELPSLASEAEVLIRGISNLLETLRSVGGRPSAKLLADATEIVEIASKFLKVRYYQRGERSPEENLQLQWVRAQLRMLAPALGDECQRAWEAMDPRRKAGGEGVDKPPARFFTDALHYASLWGDTPEQSAEEFEKALAATDRLEPALGLAIRNQAIQNREKLPPILPIVVAWNVSDRPRVREVRNRLLAKLHSGAPDRQLDASYLSLLRYYHVSDEALRGKVPDEILVKEFQAFYETLNGIFPQIVSGEVSAGPLSEALWLALQIAEKYDRPGVTAVLRELQKSLLLRLLQSRWAGPTQVYNPLFRELAFTDSEIPQFLAAIQAIPLPASGKWSHVHYQTLVRNQTRDGPVFAPPSTPSPLAPNALAPTYRFPIPKANDDTLVESVLPCDGRFLVEVRRRPEGLTIVELDPRNGRQKTVLDGESLSDREKFAELENCPNWTADSRNVYFFGERTIHRFDRSSRAVESREISLFSDSPAVLRVVLGQLYLMQSGALIRIDPVSLQAELLASAKRRPAQTILDDRPEVHLVPIEDGGNLALLGKDEIYRWNAGRRNFEAAPVMLRPRSQSAYDPDFILRVHPQLSRELFDWTGDPGYWILLDLGRTGKVTAEPSRWPPHLNLQGSGRFTSHIHGMSAGGSTLFVVFSGGGGRNLYILVSAKSAVFCAPLGAEVQPRRAFESPQIAATEAGALIWKRTTKELFFYGLKDLEKFPK